MEPTVHRVHVSDVIDLLETMFLAWLKDPFGKWNVEKANHIEAGIDQLKQLFRRGSEIPLSCTPGKDF